MNITVSGLDNSSGNSKIRSAAVAGQFYDGNPARLQANIDKMREEIGEVEPVDSVRALILPHAGYVYSGKAALAAILKAAGNKYRRAVIMAPSHRVGFEGVAMCSYEAYATPLGDVAVDLEAVQALQDQSGVLLQTIDRAHDNEHALEVEVPLLQSVFEDLPIVPLITGYVEVPAARKLAEKMKYLWNSETLWVISSDFTHYGHGFGYVPFRNNIPERLRELDLGAAGYITKCDLEGFAGYLDRTGATICGRSAIMVLLAMIEKHGGINGELVEYYTSGDVTGDWSRCVSYASVLFKDDKEG